MGERTSCGSPLLFLEFSSLFSCACSWRNTHTPPPPSCRKQSNLTKTPLFFSKAIVEEGTRTKTGKYYSLQPRITLLSFFLSQTEQVFSVSSNVQTKLLPTEDTIMGSLINSYAKAFTTTAAHVHHMNV